MRHKTLEPLTAVRLNGQPHASAPGSITHIPRFSTVRTIGDSQLSGMVEVEWQGEYYAVFPTDLAERTEGLDDERTIPAPRFRFRRPA